MVVDRRGRWDGLCRSEHDPQGSQGDSESLAADTIHTWPFPVSWPIYVRSTEGQRKMEVGAIGGLLDLDTRYVLYPFPGRFQHSLAAHSTADYSSLSRVRGKNCANHTENSAMDGGG